MEIDNSIDEIRDRILKYKKVTKPQLKKLPEYKTIPMRTFLKSRELYSSIRKILAEKEQKNNFKKRVYDRLRKNRKIDTKRFVVIQDSVITLPKARDIDDFDIYNNVKVLKKKKKHITIFEQIEDNPYIVYVDRHIIDILDDANKALYKNNDIIAASVQLKYITSNDTIRYTNSVVFSKNKILTRKDFTFNLVASNIFYIIIGYNISYVNSGNNQITNQTLYNLKAYYPSSNIKFHQLTTASTNNNKLCIYESYLDITNRFTLLYSKRNKANHDKILEELKNEGSEIEKCVKNGELIKSLELLTKKYNNEINIIYFDSKITVNNNDDLICEERPIKINNGITMIMDDKQIIDLNGIKCMLYEKNVHVAPSIFRLNKYEKVELVKKKQDNKYKLRMKKIKGDENKIKSVFGYDVETYLDNELNCNCFCITLFGHKGDEKIKKSYYGNNVISEFVQYIDSISTKINNKKSKQKTKVPYINIYGFNNSRFDNLFIYEELFKLDPNTEYVFAGNGIKYICYNNVRIYDISLHYKLGDLRSTAKKFKLEKEKGIYPYSFPNKDNLNYIGPLPKKEFWNSDSDRKQYLKNHNWMFNLKEYTLKYCMLDSELVYGMALKHIASSIGTINGSKYNVVDAQTSAKLSLVMFSQVFQEEDLSQSPDDIVAKEKLAYKGGRTEVFKKMFKRDSHKRLYYYDINSAYPAGMTEMMPYKYIRKVVTDNQILKIDDITDYNLYLAKSEYKGTDSYFIPNLLIRKNGNIIACKDSEYAYHWGNELKEAIKNGCEIKVNEIHIYEGKAIFKSFAEYFYNERLKIKKSNEVLALFYKNVLNSLYGKFGQNVFNKTCMCRDMNEVYKIIKGDMTKLISVQPMKEFLMIEYKCAGDEYESIGKLVRFSSYIASTARCKLSEMMREVGHENVYYCDTDSVFTSKKPNSKFIDDNILGKWKLETKPIIEAVFIAPKCYKYVSEENYLSKDMRIDNKICKKAKGLKSDLIKGEEYNNLVNGTIDEIKNTSKMFIRSFSNIKIIDQERTLRCIYNKRIWAGNNSTPYNNINDWADKNL